MEILVCIKQVPGTSEVEVDALETALKIKEENGTKVKVLSMGPPQAKQIIQEAFMMGADEGALVSDRKFAGADVLATSYTISQGIRKFGDTDLIICGKQTTDGDTAQVGPEIEEFLNIPHVTNVTKLIETKEKSIVVEVDMPNTREICEVEFPCLITVEKEIFQPRLPSFRLKLETKDKEIPMISLKDFEDKDEKHYGLNGSPTQVLKIFPPTSDIEKEVWSGQEISSKLLNKIKDLKLI